MGNAWVELRHCAYRRRGAWVAKRVYYDLIEAQGDARARGGAYNAYRCPVCAYFHIGRAKPPSRAVKVE